MFDDPEDEPKSTHSGQVNKGRATDPFSYYYWMYRDSGQSHDAAKKQAFAHLRADTDREVTSGWDEYKDTFMSDAPGPDDIIQFRQVVDKTEKRFGTDSRHMQYLYLLIRFMDMEDYLDTKHQKQADALVGNNYPESKYDMGRMMGYTGNLGSFYKYQGDIMKWLQQAGLHVPDTKKL